MGLHDGTVDYNSYFFFQFLGVTMSDCAAWFDILPLKIENRPKWKFHSQYDLPRVSIYHLVLKFYKIINQCHTDVWMIVLS